MLKSLDFTLQMYAPPRSDGSTTAMASGGRRRVHTTWPDGMEFVEEFSAATDELLVRRWKSGASALSKASKWEYEIGEAPAESSGGGGGAFVSSGSGGFRASSSRNPVFLCRDSAACFVWRVRNMPYPEETYQLAIDHEKQQIILRTTNKKYFKKWDIPTLKRLGLGLDMSQLSYSHSGTTLVINYEKDDTVLVYEEESRQRRLTAADVGADGGDVGCAQQ